VTSPAPSRWPDADAAGRRLLGLLADLELPAEDHAVFGSGPLLVRGIVPTGSDLDVLCRGDAWEIVQRLGIRHEDAEHDVTLVHLHGGELSFGTSWGIGRFDVDALIDTAEPIDGIRFVRMEHVVAYKRIAARAKDLEHLRLLASWRRTTSARGG
jgi:hypothetical protein